MSDERIDLTQFEAMFEGDHPKHLFEEVEKKFKDGSVRTTPLYLDLQYVNAITLLPDLLAELKRCYDLIDAMNGNVPYVEHCEECGATDGGEAEGCDYCGITHYQSKPRGFYHKDSPKW